MVEKILRAIKENFPDYKTEKSEGPNNQITISSQKGPKSGFDIDINEKDDEITISFTSKVRLIGFGIALGLTFILVYLFGGSILNGFGLVSETGHTVKILYLIPLVIFLIPSGIISSIISKKINPTDTELLKKVQEVIAALGLESSIL